MFRSLNAIICLLLLLSLLSAQGRADVITDWNDVLLGTVRAQPLSAPVQTRVTSILNTAMYDAVNSVAQTHFPYYKQFPVVPGTSPDAAAAQAAHQVLSTLYPARQAEYDAALAASLAAIADGPGKTAGIDLGLSSANAILTLRADDNSSTPVPYEPGSNPGDWVPTPPGFAPAAVPHWGLQTTWAMESAAQFRNPVGPPALDSPEYAEYFNEVKEMGRVDSNVRTPEQSLIAQFWESAPGSDTGIGQWIRIATRVSEDNDLTLEQNARLFALVSMAQADSFIMIWDTKYHYEHWRPVTAIRAADTDGNPATEPDPEWTPFLNTPAFPAYISAHSGQSGAAAAVLADFFETDNVSFLASHAAAAGLEFEDRPFESFSAAATEAMNSRLYGGIHWRYDNEDGLAAGFEVGHYVYATKLLPIPEPTSGLLGLLAAILLLPGVRGQRKQ